LTVLPRLIVLRGRALGESVRESYHAKALVAEPMISFLHLRRIGKVVNINSTMSGWLWVEASTRLE
jgi:hypothetical protein